jgi:ADP-heptose:LPS heptosyltransferase
VVRDIVAALTNAGHRVVVTAGPDEQELAAFVGGEPAGRTSMAELATLLAGASGVVTGNTGPAHLAAAVGTPVVSLYAPTVPFGQWGPYRVPHVRLGDAAAPCRDTRATRCPVDGHPCLSTIDPADVLAALRLLGVHTPAANEYRMTDCTERSEGQEGMHKEGVAA